MALNKTFFGFFLGLFLPLVGFLIVFAALHVPGQNLEQFTKNTFAYPRLASLYLTLSILINAIPFAIFNTKKMDRASRGIFVITMLYCVLVLWIRFVLS